MGVERGVIHIRCSIKKDIFGPKLGRGIPHGDHPGGQHKQVVFWVYRHNCSKEIKGYLKKNQFYAKKCIFALKMHFLAPKMVILGTYKKTESAQSCLRIWGSYDPLESVSSEPKKGG